MLKNWREEFDEAVLRRGYDYYLDGHVGTVIKTNGGYEAFVQGLNRYQVVLEVRNDEVTGMSCDCPCGYNCKHEAALLYALEQEIEIVDKQIKDDDIGRLINKIPANELTTIIKEACHNNYDLFQSLLIKYSNDLSDGQKFGFKNALYSINQCEWDFFYDDDSYISYVDDLENFIRTKINDLINNNKLQFGYELLKEAVREAVKYDVDEYDYWHDGLFNSIYEQLINLYDRGSNRFKEELLSDLNQHLDDRIFSNVIERFLIEYIQDRSFQEKRLADLDELIECDESGYYVLKRIVLMKVMAMSQKEIEEVLDEYYEKPDVRNYLIEQHLQNGRQLEAIDVLEDSLQMDSWHGDKIQKLMKLYKANNMLDKWAPLAYQTVLNNSYRVDDRLYNELKGYYGNQKWQEMKKDLYAKATKEQLYQYYVLDDEYEKLFEVVKDEPIVTISKYENYLKKYYPQELLIIYRNYIVDYGENAKHRSAYDHIEDYLNKMLTYPGGKEVVGRIKNEWINRFPTRKMLIERLMKMDC